MTTPCPLLCHYLPAAQNFLATIWPLIEILRSLVTCRNVCGGKMRWQVPQLHNGARLEEWIPLVLASRKVDYSDTESADGRFDTG